MEYQGLSCQCGRNLGPFLWFCPQPLLPLGLHSLTFPPNPVILSVNLFWWPYWRSQVNQDGALHFTTDRGRRQDPRWRRANVQPGRRGRALLGVEPGRDSVPGKAVLLHLSVLYGQIYGCLESLTVLEMCAAFFMWSNNPVAGYISKGTEISISNRCLLPSPQWSPVHSNLDMESVCWQRSRCRQWEWHNGARALMTVESCYLGHRRTPRSLWEVASVTQRKTCIGWTHSHVESEDV